MPVLSLHPNSAAAVFVPQRSRAHVEASGDALRKALGIVGCFNPNHVTTDLVLEFERSTESYERSEEHTSELQSLAYLVCRLLLEKKKTNYVHLLDALRY